MERFYNGKTILLTGGTGFIGKVVIEKLLRDVSNIHKIVLVIRAKKGLPPSKRMEKEVVQSPIFDRLRHELGKDFEPLIHSKLVAVNGDITMDNLGLCPADFNAVVTNVDVVIHLAASVSFNEPLDTAVEMNCVGALNVLNLVLKCHNILCFVHVSTAYVNSNKKQKIIEEKLYPLDFDVEEAMTAIQNASPAELEKLHLNLIGTYPNTYTLTKSMAEHLIASRRGSVPTVILRPSIVASAWKEPVPGWVDNVSAAGAVVLAMGLGILTMLPGDPRNISDIVPVDFVSSSILVAAAVHASTSELVVIHSGTSDPRENPVRWRVLAAVSTEYWQKHPPKRGAIFKPHFAMIKSPQYFQTLWWLRYTAPASVYSTVANLIGDQRHLKNAAKLQMAVYKASTISQVFKPFTENEWIFVSNGLAALRQHTKSFEKFNLDSKAIVWERYYQNFSYGLKKWILHDDLIDVTSRDSVNHTALALNTGRILEWDSDHHVISFPGLFSDLSWAYTSSRKPGYTKSGFLGKIMGLTGWTEGQNHEASHVPRPIALGYNETLDLVMENPDLVSAIASEAEKEGHSEETIRAEAYEILQTMAASVDYTSVRKLGWMLRKIWRQMYEEIKVDEAGLEVIRNLARNSSPTESEPAAQPLVLLPTHRSYIDFLILSYLFFAYNLPIPFIAAADDFLNIKGVTELLRSSGAYFIKRSFKSHNLYNAVFQAYTHHILEKGFSLEFFIEGTRSRSGKQLQPKLGMLSSVKKAFDSGKIRDAQLIPIAIDYEKPIELMLHQKELIGDGKIKMSLSGLLQSSTVLAKHFGTISIRFGTPISLKQYVKTFTGENLVPTLAYDLSDAMVALSSCMPSHLVATLLLTHRHGVSMKELVELTDWLRIEVSSRCGTVMCAEGLGREEVLERALKLLGPFIYRPRKALIQPAIASREQYQNMIGLGYYRNKLIHLFDQEGVVACAYYNVMNKTEGRTSLLLVETACFLMSLLSFEFVRSPVNSVETKVRRTLRDMCERGTFLTENEIVTVSASGERLYSVLCGLIWPFIDSYWVAIMSLFAYQRRSSVVADKTIDRKELVDRMQWLAETMYHERVIAHYESCSKETLNNTITLLLDWNVLSCVSSSLLQLTPAYCQKATSDGDDKLQKLASKISAYRKLPLSSQAAPSHERIHQLVAELPVLAKL